MPPAMGQPINVVEKPSSTPGIARFETNRSLTGMGHERYLSAEDVIDDRPVDELARRLFETGGVTQVHSNGSMVTVHLADGWTGGRLLDVIRGLYVFYPPAAPTETEAETMPVPEAETAAEAQDTPDTVTEPHEADEATAEQEPAPQPEVVPEPESSISAGVDPAAEPDLEPAPDQDPEAVADAEVEAAELEANGPEAAQPEPAPNSGTERAPAGTKSPK
jgi:hypothetical protein